MNYLEVAFQYDPQLVDGEVLLAEVATLPFESFAEEDGRLLAYILIGEFNPENLSSLPFLIENQIQYQVTEIQQVNWNEEWEKNFPFVEVGDNCVVKANFHQLSRDYLYTININPKMSFGTGHHATTALMLGYMLDMNFEGKQVLDMGTGTGVLAILAAMKGADNILAIDNHDWAFENSVENVALNGYASKIDLKLGEVDLIGQSKFDIVLANINKNVIKSQLGIYQDALVANGTLLLSGILIDDLNEIKHLAENLGLKFVKQDQKDKWCLLVLSK